VNTFRRTFLFTFILLVLVLVSLGSGFLLNEYLTSRHATFPILSQAYDLLIQNGYTDPPAAPALEYGMIRGMLAEYGDPYTTFSEPAQHELETGSLQGSYGGIGANLGIDPQGFHVLFPYPDSPAARAGVVEGDRILQVDDLIISSETAKDILQAALQGPSGEGVTLRLSRPPEHTEIEVSIQREEIPIPSVTWHLEPADHRLGVIRVNLIAATTREEILNAVLDLQSRGATAFALDLRDNYGGLLDSGIEISRLFLSSGVVIEQQYRDEPVEIFSVEQPGELADLLLVVLVNQNTASAAEIIAGSLQAHGRAVLIGDLTYGKDSIQLVFQLDDGSSLHITAAHWWIPTITEPLAGTGLQPDLPAQIGSTSGTDPYIQAALENLFFP